MAIVFVLRAFSLTDALVGEKRLTSLPIRIGRNPLADFQLKQSYISDFHALIEDVDGRLCIRDLNSKNGVYTPAPNQPLPVRIEPQSVVDLWTCGFKFSLGVQIHCTIEFEESAAPLLSERTSVSVGSVLGNQAVLLRDSSSARAPSSPDVGLPLDAPGGRPGAHGRDLAARLPQGFGQPPGAPGQGLPPIPVSGGSASALPPPPGMSSGAPQGLPPLGASGFAPVAAPAGWSPEDAQRGPAHTGVLNLSLEAMALVGLQELAGSLAPGKALGTTGDVARFITKLHDSIEVFCRCFIPLREGYAQFVSSLDLQKASLRRSAMRSPSYVAVEAARAPEAVAAALLDWRDRSMDAPRAVEGIFADLMIHQVAVLDGVMQGVRSLLEQLSPDNIEEQLGPQGPFAKARHKALWETYRTRFEELAEEKQAFAHIFGPEFTDAYRAYRKQREE